MKAEILRNLKKLNLSGYTLATNSIYEIKGIPCRDISVGYVQIVRAFLTTMESRNYYTLEDVTTRFFELYTDPEDFLSDYSELLAQLSTRRAREFM
tara:strand:+ start:2765 stop:3052 length:288 start_codon:yes stop_codon:yes gene_type:complete